MLVATPVGAQGTHDASRIDAMFAQHDAELDALYRDIHAHPELGFHETRTVALLAAKMRALGFTVTEHVSKTGVVALYRNGAGPTVLVRTELDALPMAEKTGLAYASHAQQVIDGHPTDVDHACGHDIHMVWWVGTAETLLAMKDHWHGTLLFVAQPAEELISGAKAMLDDGLFTRFPKPDYGFAAHIGPAPAGTITVKQGVATSASDTVFVTFHGVGAHGAMPDKSIDPIIEAVHFVDDIQTIVSRQKDPQKFGVIAVGSFHAGTAANIIPDHADLQLTLRALAPETRKVLNDGVATTADAAASMAHAPSPDIVHAFGTGPVVNDPVLATCAAALLQRALLNVSITLVPTGSPGSNASEDYSDYVAAGMTRSVFFSIDGYDPATIARYRQDGKSLPVNHSPYFAPDPTSSIGTGVETLTLAVLMVAGDR